MGEILEEVGIVFMFAPLLHPAMRHVGPVRRTLGITTIMNILGPLTNPAGALRQVMGVADPSLRNLVARALKEIGHLRALVVYGDPGMDELSPSGVTHVTAAAIFVAGRSVSLQEGVQLAESSIDSGAASDALERLKIASSL